MSSKYLISILLFVCLGDNIAQVTQITTVVHVIHSDQSENRTTEEINDIIDHVNKGLRGLSDNNIYSREIFDNLWADTEIQLCLAAVNEFGQAAEGIIRTEIEEALVPEQYIYHEMRGISDPWDTDKYLNIWMGSLGPDSETNGGLASNATNPHSSFPNPHIGVSINLDGYNPKQILIHEIGHFFGLEHIYSDDIEDTPCSNNAIGPETECLDEFLEVNTCEDTDDLWGGIDVPDMVENYMEYYGNCSKMFTYGQKELMHHFIDNFYQEMVNSNTSHCDLLSNTNIVSNATKIAVYPNPVIDLLQIDFDEHSEFDILDIAGRTIKIGNCHPNEAIDLSEIEDGFYFLRILLKEQLHTTKFIKHSMR